LVCGYDALYLTNPNQRGNNSDDFRVVMFMAWLRLMFEGKLLRSSVL
jgi:hypothetical protein